MLDRITLRDFSGGLNVIDADLNVSTKYSRVEENIYTASDGSKKIRYGYSLFNKLSGLPLTVRELNLLNVIDVNGNIVITDTNHGLITGHKITISGIVGTIGGISESLINGVHIIERVDANSYKIKVDAVSTIERYINEFVVTFDNKNIIGRIVNMTYFQDNLIVVSSSGQVIAVDGDKNSLVIFNNDIAVKIGALKGWSTTDFACLEIFNGQLTIWNGFDKPLVVDLTNLTRPCQFLSDPATNSNANVPICKYAVTINHYMVAFGDPLHPDRIHISMKDACGVWHGDADSDGVYVDLGKIVSCNNMNIKGGFRFRDNIVVAFDSRCVIGTLGTYVEVTDATTREVTKVHEPSFEDVIDGIGTISHRSMSTLSDKGVMCDIVGVPCLKTSVFSNKLSPERLSTLVDPLMQESLQIISELSSENYIFSILDVKKYHYMLFIPNSNTYGDITETLCYVYSFSPNNKNPTWTLFRGFNFDCGCVSSLRSVFFAKNDEIFLYGSEENKIYDDNGKDIDFIWESAWSDLGSRANIKKLKYLKLDSTGTSRFVFDFYVDGFYDKKYTITYEPELSTEFVGGSKSGFGTADNTFGGGRRTSDERLYAFPSKFNICKFSIHGKTKLPLNIISITMLLNKGGFRR